MIAAYALAAAPLQRQIGATIPLGSPGWTALASLAAPLVAVVAREGSVRAKGHQEDPERDLAWGRDILAVAERWRGFAADLARAAAVFAAALGQYREACADLEKALGTFCRDPAPAEEADPREGWATGSSAAGNRPAVVQKIEAAIRPARRIDATGRWVERLKAVRERMVAEAGYAERAAESGRGPASAMMRCKGDYWIVSDGRSTIHLRDLKGLHYIRQLLCHPGEERHVLDLVGWGPPDADPRPDANRAANGGLPVLDAEARRTYRRRVRELRAELAQADEFNDWGRAEQARGEIDALTAQLSTAVGLGGRSRVTGSVVERARSTVTHGIKGALRSIRDGLPTFGAELALRLKTGTFCVYLPDPINLTHWTL